MRRSTDPNSAARGFSLIEVAVAVAIMAILAGAAAPLIMKSLNQAREQKTRENLKIAYESIYGARDRRVANMRADYGFSATNAADLRTMTTAGTMRLYRQSGTDPFAWGWNGPYWTGPVGTSPGTNGLPLDGWGRPIRLVANRLVSDGPDGVTSADDISYPTAPGTLSSSLVITVNRVTSDTTTKKLQITVSDRNNDNTNLRQQNPPIADDWPHSFSGSGTFPTKSIFVNPGPVLVHLESSPTDTNYDEQCVVDLLPGENRAITFQLNN
jgi:prepilin-type N-terminal cleavage/methylation domain-containing protein